MKSRWISGAGLLAGMDQTKKWYTILVMASERRG